MLFEVFYKFKIIQDSKEKGATQKRDRLIKLLDLNKRVLNIHNKMSLACNKYGDYQKSYVYIICALFIYNNSLKMIDQSDPLKYPKKNTNEFLMGNEKNESDDIKSSFSRFIQGFNESYKKTLTNYEALWKFIEQNSSKFKQEFFQAVKDGMDYFNQAISFTKRDFNTYISGFSNSGHEISATRSGFYLLSNYQDNYIGNIEPLDIDEFVDLKVQSTINFIQAARKSKEEIPSWIRDALGLNLEEYRKGKLNKIKVGLYFKFVSMNTDLMAEALCKMVYKSQEHYVSENYTPAVVSNGRSRPSSLENSLRIRGSGLCPTKTYSEASKELLIQKILDAESSAELFQRISAELTARVRQNMTTCTMNFMRKYKQYANRKEQMLREKNNGVVKRNLEGNKLRRRILAEHVPVDKNVGIYLRRNGNVDTYRPIATQSRFFKESLKLVETVKHDLNLASYHERFASINAVVYRSNSTSRLSACHELPSDIVNVLHKTKAYYEDLLFKNLTKTKVTKKLHVHHRTSTDLDADKSKSSRRSLLVPRIMITKEDSIDVEAAATKSTVWNIENSIDDLCKLEFLFLVDGVSSAEFFKVAFKIDQEKIAFIFRFEESDIKFTSCEFTLSLPQELWILKERLMLNSNPEPELIKTYNPVIYSILSKCFFSAFFSQSAKGLSIQPADVSRIENLKRHMGLMYPVEMTRLASYDFDYFREINLFHQEFTKIDLDNLQALLLVISYFARLVRSLRMRSPLGNYHIRKLDITKIIDKGKSSISQMNSLFVLEFKVTLLKKKFDENLFRSYACDKPSKDFQDVSLNDVMTLLERLATRSETLNILNIVSSGNDQSNKNMETKGYLRRNVVVDEYGMINFADLGYCISRAKIKQDINQLGDLLKTLHSELKGYMAFNKTQMVLLLFFLILEHCLSFTVEIDSEFRQKWKRGFSKKSSIQTTEGEKRGALKKAILEITVPKLSPQLDEGITLSELYYIGQSNFNNATTASRLRPTEHPLFEDLLKRPFAVFQFLMAICLKIETSPAVNHLNHFLVKTIQEEKEFALEKTRCFYMIRRLEKNTEVKIFYCYRFRYSYLRRFTKSLTTDLRIKLKKLITVSKENKGVSKQPFNNFFSFYELTIRDQDKRTDLKIESPKLCEKEESASKELSLKAKPEATTKKDPKAVLFNSNFAEALQHVSKSTNVKYFNEGIRIS